MARASIPTLIPLDTFAKVVGLDPIHFNSIYTERRPETRACDDVWYQYAWQSVGRVSREEVARILQQAEEQVAQYLGYYPVPTWVTDEEHRLTPPAPPELTYLYSLNTGGRAKSLRTKYGYFIVGGRKTKSLVEAGATVTYTSEDGDSYKETATVTVTTTVTDIEELHVYFPGRLGADIWEIRPVDVAISGGTATITFRRYQCVLPALWEKIPSETDPMGVDGDDDDNFITTVDVYRVYNDPSAQLSFYTEDLCAFCGGSGCDACSDTSESGCMQIRDRRLGIVRYERANWDEDEEEFVGTDYSLGYEPERVRVWYRAGKMWPHTDYPHYRMDPSWERAIIFYALTKLDTELCGCANFKRIYDWQREDFARSYEDRSYVISQRNLDNPLGTTLAAKTLWEMIRQDRLGMAS